jgi:tetratricopeptide (TPR) repeat protein
MSIKTDRLLSKAYKLFNKGENIKAREIFLSILQSFPNNLDAKKGLSLLNQKKAISPSKSEIDDVMQFYSLRQMDKAQSAVQRLLKEFPNDSLLYNISGACYSEAGKIEFAINSFEKALAINPEYSEVYFNLGVAYQNLSELEKAKISYEKAIELKHAYPTAHNNLGLIFLGRKELESAVKCFEWAVAYSPEYAEGYNSLGASLQELKQFEKAKEQFEKAVSLNPSYAQAFHNLGILSEMINLPNEALNHYEKTVSINPKFADAFRNLSKLKNFKISDPQIHQMKSLYSEKGLNISDKVKMCFALAKVYEDIGEHEKFFKFLNEGNRLRKTELNYSLNESKDFQISVMKLFNKAPPKINKSSLKSSNIKPIFIIGMPRSGTSLLEQIISSHNSVYGAGELTNLKETVSPTLEDFINKKSNSINEKDLLRIRQEYLDSLSSINTSEKIITDKMPLNFRLIGFILSAMPEAKIIHIKRDAIATCWSNYKHYFTNGNGFSFDQEDLAEFYGLYLELMNFWYKLFPNQIYDVNYEKLTTNQKIETQNLLKYCDLDWDEHCLNFHKNKRAVETASASQVRKKIYQGSSDAWREYEDFLQPLIKGLENF